MSINPNSLVNLNRNGRIAGSKNRKKFSDLVSNETYQKLIEGLVDIALNDKYAKNRIAATAYIIDRLEGRIPATINMVNSDVPVSLDELKAMAKDVEENGE